MQQPDGIAARRLSILIEQYVEARKKRYDYVSTEQAYRAIRQVLKPAIPDRELDDMVALACREERPGGRFRPPNQIVCRSCSSGHKALDQRRSAGVERHIDTGPNGPVSMCIAGATSDTPAP
ncbi:hypothetical protein [Mesorhizobium sp.]|uniref:hypothetical protein n=1 Tax=Mesorhizobium sp. TaxID=1871066 RepID=UPI0025E26D76|nr:hypothetical protein [Mesorhizobium sp.]